MKIKNKILKISLISLLILCGMFDQIYFFAPSNSTVNNLANLSENDNSETIKSSDVSGSYDLDDGNTMDIDAIDNTTTTTFNNNIDGRYITVESNKNNTYTSTILNDTYHIKSELDTPFHLEHLKHGDYNVYIPNNHQLDFDIGQLEFHSNATVNEAENSLDSFYANTTDQNMGTFCNISYLKGDVDGYDLKVLSGDPGGIIKTNFNYSYESNEFKWRDDTYSPYITLLYIINETGVWQDGSQVIDWTNEDLEHYSYHYENWLPGPVWSDIYDVNITKEHNITTIHFYGYYGDRNADLYELVFTRSPDGIIMDYVIALSDTTFRWMKNQLTLFTPLSNPEIPADYSIFTIYLWDMVDLVYTYLFEMASLDFKFYREWTDIVFFGISISIIYRSSNIIFTLGLLWDYWSYRASYIFDILLNTYVLYKVIIGYYIWTYVFYVPTLYLPNFLMIKIIESIYTDSWFYITISVKSYIGNPISGATITGTWDGVNIGTVDDNNDGTYNFTLPAKFVSPGEEPLWLNLTATKNGYADGFLNTEMAIEPYPPFPFKQLKINIIESIYSEDYFNLTVEITNCSGDREIGASLTGMWNYTTLQSDVNIFDNGDGTFNLTLIAILVSPGDPGIPLSLTAVKGGYVDGVLNTKIAVDPDVVSKVTPPPSDDGDDDDDENDEEESIPIILVVIGAVALISIMIIIIKKLK